MPHAKAERSPLPRHDVAEHSSLPPHDVAERSPLPRHDIARRAFSAEQERMRHYRKALACAKNAALRDRWTTELEASRGRAARLAITLVEMGEAIPAPEDRHDSTRCLLDAMDMALCNGDKLAAEAVALECMRLIDMRCDRIRAGSR